MLDDELTLSPVLSNVVVHPSACGNINTVVRNKIFLGYMVKSVYDKKWIAFVTGKEEKIGDYKNESGATLAIVAEGLKA